MKLKLILFATALTVFSLSSFAQQGFNTNSPKSTVDINGSLGTAITEVTDPSTFTLTDAHQTLVFRGVGGSIVLPAATTCLGREYTLVNFSTGNITSSVTIDAGTAVTNIVPTMTIFKVKSNGTNWVQVGKTGGGGSSTADGSETKVEPGVGGSTKITGTGTSASPYKVDIKFFYMPSIAISTVALGAGSKDLYQLYYDQFTSADPTTSARSPLAPAVIPNFPTKTDLYYYVTYYDKDVFGGVTVDANGVLNYNVLTNATDATFMNIVFVVK
jgi:hypothetical protein